MLKDTIFHFLKNLNSGQKKRTIQMNYPFFFMKQKINSLIL